MNVYIPEKPQIFTENEGYRGTVNFLKTSKQNTGKPHSMQNSAPRSSWLKDEQAFPSSPKSRSRSSIFILQL